MAILRQILFCAGTFGALKLGFRSLATLKRVVNVVGGFLATARLSCYSSLGNTYRGYKNKNDNNNNNNK